MATTGTKYERSMDTAEIAKRIRADIKAAQKSGALPASLKVSVRTSRFSMGSSIDVSVVAAPVQVHASDFIAHHVATKGREFWAGERYTAPARALLAKLEAIGEAYQRSEHDSQADYHNTNFYLHVKFGWELEQEDRAILTEYHEALSAPRLRHNGRRHQVPGGVEGQCPAGGATSDRNRCVPGGADGRADAPARVPCMWEAGGVRARALPILRGHGGRSSGKTSLRAVQCLQGLGVAAEKST